MNSSLILAVVEIPRLNCRKSWPKWSKELNWLGLQKWGWEMSPSPSQIGPCSTRPNFGSSTTVWHRTLRWCWSDWKKQRGLASRPPVGWLMWLMYYDDIQWCCRSITLVTSQERNQWQGSTYSTFYHLKGPSCTSCCHSDQSHQPLDWCCRNSIFHPAQPATRCAQQAAISGVLRLLEWHETPVDFSTNSVYSDSGYHYTWMCLKMLCTPKPNG